MSRTPADIPVFILVVENIGNWTNQASSFNAPGKFQSPVRTAMIPETGFWLTCRTSCGRCSAASSALLFPVDGKPQRESKAEGLSRRHFTVILPLVLNEANI
jgi:hypothetical protein